MKGLPGTGSSFTAVSMVEVSEVFAGWNITCGPQGPPLNQPIAYRELSPWAHGPRSSPASWCSITVTPGRDAFHTSATFVAGAEAFDSPPVPYVTETRVPVLFTHGAHASSGRPGAANCSSTGCPS